MVAKGIFQKAILMNIILCCNCVIKEHPCFLDFTLLYPYLKCNHAVCVILYNVITEKPSGKPINRYVITDHAVHWEQIGKIL